MTLPIWIYFVILGIFVSGFMAVKTAREDYEVEREWIEKEGQVYLDRMEKEKERRAKMKQAI